MTTTLQLQPDMDANLQLLDNQLNEVNYQLAERSAKLAALESLESFAEQFAQAYPGKAEPLAWQGLILSTRADVAGGMAALAPAKAALEVFKKSLQIDETAMDATAHTSLGVLYTQVPSWPIGFGSEAEAKKHLQCALALYPDDIEANLYMAEFIDKFQDRAAAISQLEKALELAVAHTERNPGLDARQQKIEQMLQSWRG